jgi:hypothetical protein
VGCFNGRAKSGGRNGRRKQECLVANTYWCGVDRSRSSLHVLESQPYSSRLDTFLGTCHRVLYIRGRSLAQLASPASFWHQALDQNS